MNHKILAQDSYVDHDGHEINAKVADVLTTYKHVCDGFYESECGACGANMGSRSCGWPIDGQILFCEKCGKGNLLLRSDSKWLHEQLDKAARVSYVESEMKRLTEEMTKIQQSEPGVLLERIRKLEHIIETAKKCLA